MEMYLIEKTGRTAPIGVMALFTPRENNESTLPGSVYHPDLCDLAGKFTSGAFLSRCIHWWVKSGRAPFWKSNTRAGDDDTGRSWEEQEGFTENELVTARKRVATRVKKSEVKDNMRVTVDDLSLHKVMRTRTLTDNDGNEYDSHEVTDTYYVGLNRCILYWRNGSGRMWYKVNEAMVTALMIRRTEDKKAAADEAYTPLTNIEILEQVQGLFPNAEIDLGEGQPEQKDAPAPAAKAKPKKKATKAPQGETDAPKPKKKKVNTYRLAVAWAFDYTDDDGKPNPANRVIGTVLSQLLGTAKKGQRQTWAIEDGMTDVQIVAFGLWYRELARRQDYTQKTPPTSAERLKDRVDEYLGMSAANRAAWEAKGKQALDRLVQGMTATPTALEKLQRIGENDEIPSGDIYIPPPQITAAGDAPVKKAVRHAG